MVVNGGEWWNGGDCAKGSQRTHFYEIFIKFIVRSCTTSTGMVQDHFIDFVFS